MKVIVASDHTGYWARQMAVQWLHNRGYTVVEMGAENALHQTDDLKVTDAAMHAFQQEQADRAVLISGNGIGMSMRANRYPFARAFVVQHRLTARQARETDNANVLCFEGERICQRDVGIDLERFFDTVFEETSNPGRLSSHEAPALIKE